MNSELILNIVGLFNVIVCIIIIAVITWGTVYKRHVSKLLLGFILAIFFLLIWQIVGSQQLDPIIVLFTLLALLFQILLSLKPSADIEPLTDQSIIISQVKEQERSRIYANLHDDVGAKLLELIYSAEDEKTKSLAKEVLSNIRQAVASTVNIQCNVQQLIEEVLSECSLRLESANMVLDTTTDIVNGKQNLAAAIPSVVSRIFREVISNVIKHSKAKQVRMTVTSNQDLLKITVVDNGVGFKICQKNGKGLKTIQKRAKSISAVIEWKTQADQGTEFILQLPI